MKTNNKGSIIPVVIAAIAVLIVGGVYLVMKNKPISASDVNPIVVPVASNSTAQDSGASNASTSTSQNQDQTEAVPVITSITPSSGPIGTVVTIQGKNLSGFEGDLKAYFVRKDGDIITLTDTFGDYTKTAGNTIKVSVKIPCPAPGGYRGNTSIVLSPCDSTSSELAPGNYEVYAKPWGKESNRVKFTVTSNDSLVACTMDAKMCPDGSYVGRVGPKCEFQACPTTTDWKIYSNSHYSFSIQYPSTWKYQEFNCNLSGVAFYPINDNDLSRGVTCSANSPIAPIYFYYPTNGRAASSSLVLSTQFVSSIAYKQTYNEMVKSFVAITN
ncbi:MAG: IPT/TIG domain-containing protein [Candidatus Taylorbacteria bacterium]|nr:IPT/TIG domain-containing protein [Candidatus Taylorbacteria bacterium]